jgi:hypothetical protein
MLLLLTQVFPDLRQIGETDKLSRISLRMKRIAFTVAGFVHRLLSLMFSSKPPLAVLMIFVRITGGLSPSFSL